MIQLGEKEATQQEASNQQMGRNKEESY